MAWVGSGPRHDIAGAPNRQPLTAHTCLEVGMTGPVILGRASNTPYLLHLSSPRGLRPSCPRSRIPCPPLSLPTGQLGFVPYTRYSRLDTLVSPLAHVSPCQHVPSRELAHVSPYPCAPSASPARGFTSLTETASAVRPGPRNPGRPSWPAFRPRPAPA